MPVAIGYVDAEGVKASTFVLALVEAQNHLLQKRRFATDGVRYFYQPDSRSRFIIVNERDLPDGARKALKSRLQERMS